MGPLLPFLGSPCKRSCRLLEKSVDKRRIDVEQQKRCVVGRAKRVVDNLAAATRASIVGQWITLHCGCCCAQEKGGRSKVL
jgi:hypothetical protein